MLKNIKNQFRRPSGFMGKIIAGLMKRGNLKYYVKILPDLEIKEGSRILEIGYGPGAGIKLIAKEKKDCQIEGIDFSQLMHEKASQRNDEFIKSGRMNLRYGDFLTEENTNEKYDRVFCINVIYFWIDLSIPFKKIYSSLNDDGIYCLCIENFKKKTDKDGVFRTYTIEEVTEELRVAGFSEVTFKFQAGYYIKAKK